APLRSSDRRKLKQRVIATYNISPEIGDVLVPEGLMSWSEVRFCSLISPYQVAYLSPDGDPLRFSIEKGADELIPTVYTLWKKYHLLPCITTPAAVIPVLMGGADLMIPGVVQVLSSQTMVPPQLVAIAQYNKDFPTTHGPPLAVGHLAVDLGSLKARGKGKAVHVLHSWKDCLFNVGSKVDHPEVLVEIREVGKSNEGAETDHLVQPSHPAPPFSKEGECHLDPCDDVALTRTEVSMILCDAVLQAIRSTVKSLPTASFPIPVGTFYSSF
ncbi:hypothetical protein EDD15DRAFT_2476550, partial [Pisolithus albus]